MGKHEEAGAGPEVALPAPGLGRRLLAAVGNLAKMFGVFVLALFVLALVYTKGPRDYFGVAMDAYAPVLEGLERYRAAEGAYPTSLEVMVPRYLAPEALQALRQIPHPHSFTASGKAGGGFRIEMEHPTDGFMSFPVLMHYDSADPRWVYDGN